MAKIKQLLGLSLATNELAEDLSNDSISEERLSKTDNFIYKLCEIIL
jgi:hypothetical protein